jgi:AraC-like DNA-binding protein
MATREPTLSVRALWPLARVAEGSARGLALLNELLESERIDLAQGDARVPCRVAFRALERAAEVTGDPLLGLRAGSHLDDASLDVLEFAARSTATLGDSIAIGGRYIQIINEAAELWLDRTGTSPTWCYGSSIPQPPIANDLVIASALTFARRNCVVYLPPEEIWLAHERPGHADGYAKFFGAPVRFGAPYNAMVLSEIALQTPMRERNATMASVFERRANEVVRSLVSTGSLTRRVRETLAAQFASGQVQMGDTARRLGMSIATLRRRLRSEEASFDTILDDMRKETAVRLLRQTEPSVSELAFLLGFSGVTAFGRAFKRWTGVLPSEFRARHEPVKKDADK